MKHMKKLMALFLSFVIVFSGVLPVNPAEAASMKIVDIKMNNAKYAAAKWAIDNDYMQLYTGNKFQPSTLVMEWQMLQMIAKLDQNYNFSYDKEMLYMYYGDLNIPLYGVDLAAKRNANISRGHFARLYAAMQGLDLSEVQAVQYLYMNEITTGTTGKRTYADYVPNRNITRGDMAVFMYRMAQQGGIALEGLPSEATGKDNRKITLPENFVESNGSVELAPTPGKNTNDQANRPSVYKAVQSIDVSTEELIANGVDSSLVTINLKDSYGKDIPYDTSLQFKVTSEVGATISSTNSSTSGSTNMVYTDGPELSVWVTAPALTKSYKDTIRFELVNNEDPNYYTYKNQVIETSLRYVPKAELRISYEVYDPEQPDWTSGNVDPGIKPLPAKPEGFTENGAITITDYDEDVKTFEGYKWETYTSPTTNQLTQGNLTNDAVQYGNAELKLEGQIISVWLFEQILEYMINGEQVNDTDPKGSWGGTGTAVVMYTLNSEGRPTYDLQGVMSEEFAKQFDSTLHAAVIYLIGILPKADDITLAHEESVVAIKAIYDKLGQIDKNLLQKSYAQFIGKLEGAVSKIDVLKKGQELEQRPEGWERYTKVIVNVVAPGGYVIPDFKGQVEVSFNGTTRTVTFDTNTKDYNNGTGYAGSAVVYFDDIVYGNSTITAKIIQQDTRYAVPLKELNNKTVSKSIFTNPKFEKNMCSRDAEVAFVVDHSGSVRKLDPQNYVADKTKSLIKQIQSTNNHVYHFNNKPYFEVKGDAEPVANTPSLLEYKKDGNGTKIAEALDQAIQDLSSDRFTAKAIVLVTDGKASKAKIDQVIKKAQEKQVKIYTVAVGKYNKVNEALLKQISTETGGSYFNIDNVHNLHGTYQAIINSILCATEVVDNSCVVGDALFTESSVTISRSNVILNARINSNCDNVYAVSVIFATTGGSVTYDLQHRNGYLYRQTRNVSEFKPFSLYNNVEFQAYDKNGTLVASKSIDI